MSPLFGVSLKRVIWIRRSDRRAFHFSSSDANVISITSPSFFSPTYFSILCIYINHIYISNSRLFFFAEYAAVGYIAKRIEMRKKRYQNLQKLAEQRRAALASTNSGPDNETASTVAKSHVRTMWINDDSVRGQSKRKSCYFWERRQKKRNKKNLSQMNDLLYKKL